MKSTATFSLPSNRKGDVRARPRWVIIGSTGDPRAIAFQRAMRESGAALAAFFDYKEFVSGTANLDALIDEPVNIRIEPPGRGVSTYQMFLKRGFAVPHAQEFDTLPPEEIAKLKFDKGLLVGPSQFHYGFKCVLQQIAERLQVLRRATWTCDIPSILKAFDKQACQAMLSDAGISVPRSLEVGEPLQGYEQLRTLMAEQRMSRVFIKLRYGAAGAGLIAYQVTKAKELADSTVQLVPGVDESDRLYCTRRIARYREPSEIRRLIDAVCWLGVHVEAWYPKAGVDGKVCDLRVVTIAGEPRHQVLRQSSTPFTNLHLLNQRSEVAPLVRRMSKDAWRSLLDTCRQTAACFPRMLSLGIDVAVKVGMEEHAVLEVNAFGDYLKDVTDQGLSTHEAQIRAMSSREDLSK